MKLYPFQEKVLKDTKEKNKVAYYLDMGLGKTFVGAEKLMQIRTQANLIVCQKSKVQDWIDHFESNYTNKITVYDLTKPKKYQAFLDHGAARIGVINYELAFRRQELTKLTDVTLLLDESSLIQNETAKRSKFILNKIQAKNVILLSGTPTGGKYERLWSQIRLLGWEISKDLYWKQYVDVEHQMRHGFPLKIVKGYKNVERLMNKLKEHGAVFMKTDEVFDLPQQVFNTISVDTTKEYKIFKKNRIVTIEGRELVGDMTLNKMLYERMLCGQYNQDKLEALKDLLESTEDRIIVFYNFNEELKAIEDICIELDKPVSIVNGQEKDLSCYEQYDNSVTLIQYQAGSMGLNLQKANKIVYFTPTLSCELFEQSKKRTHRIHQERTCFYYQLMCRKSVEEKIYKTLAMRKDYTERLFEKDE